MIMCGIYNNVEHNTGTSIKIFEKDPKVLLKKKKKHLKNINI